MTTLSTHDTKRSEDVRARLLLLAEDPAGWAPLARQLVTAGVTRGLDPACSYLLAQTLVGAWPLSGERLADYLTKASKEAKLLTSWIDPDPGYDAVVRETAFALATDADVARAVGGWLEERAEADLTASLSAKLVQLLMPGVPDCYQGCETTDRSLVDPDNRRPVDHDRLRAHLATGADLKQRLVATALRLRRSHPALVGPQGNYAPLDVDDDRWVAFTRGDAIAVIAPRRPLATSHTAGPDPARHLGSGWRDLLPGLPVRLLLRAA
jgi:(1->4)-alpha-D-glucan 1-alpha-D-glucosylmutase